MHPLRGLIHNQVQVTINPDDYGLFGYVGVTMDYSFVTWQWELTLADLKKLAINCITYSSLNSQEKENLNKLFVEKWNNFIQKNI